MGTFDQNFDFKIRRGVLKKISYERSAYESVDDRNLSWVISTIRGKQKSVTEKVYMDTSLCVLHFSRLKYIFPSFKEQQIFRRLGCLYMKCTIFRMKRKRLWRIKLYIIQENIYIFFCTFIFWSEKILIVIDIRKNIIQTNFTVTQELINYILVRKIQANKKKHKK